MSRKSRKGYYVNGEFVAFGSEADQKFRDELREERAPSRSAKKRAAENLQLLGATLITAPDTLLARLPLPDDLRDAILEARNIKSFGARRRQTQLIGKLMRRLDDEAADAIRTALGTNRQ